MFEALREWFERRRTLRQLRERESPHSDGYFAFFTEQIAMAQVELNHQRQQKALEVWRRMYAQFPDLCLMSKKALNLFVDLGLHHEAEALIQEGRKRYPRNKSVYDAAFARVAYRQGHLEEAVRRYEIVRLRFPQVEDGYGMAASCLSDLGRADEAEAMLERGMRKLSNNYDLCSRYAQVAVRRRDWTVGLERWTMVSSHFPHPPGPLGVAQCLKEMGRLDEAEEILSEACVRFRSNPYPFVSFADVATAKGDLAEAIKRWEVVLNRFPWFDRAYTESAGLLSKVGREAEADELLRLVMGRSPTYLPGHLEYAKSAQRRGDWPSALERWALVVAQFPECVEAIEGEASALESVSQQGNSPDR